MIHLRSGSILSFSINVPTFLEKMSVSASIILAVK